MIRECLKSCKKNAKRKDKFGMGAFPTAGDQTSLVKMWLSSQESFPSFLGCPDLSGSIVVGQAENKALGCGVAKSPMWVKTGTWEAILGTKSGAYGICVRRATERWSPGLGLGLEVSEGL